MINVPVHQYQFMHGTKIIIFCLIVVYYQANMCNLYFYAKGADKGSRINDSYIWINPGLVKNKISN